MKLIYLAGKYSAPTGHQIDDNIQLAKSVSKILWRAGFFVHCPHLNTAYFDDLVPYDQFLDGDCALLERLDAVVYLPNAADSRGAQREIAHARSKGMRVFAWPQDWNALLRWAAGEKEEGV